MKAFKTLGWRVFRWLIKPLWGRGLERFPLVLTIYRYLYITLAPQRDTPICVHGNKMFIHQGDLGFSQELLFSYGYDKCQTALFKELVSEGMNVIDLGAHIGYYTLLAAKLVGEEGKVFAFEPEPRNYALLLRNIEVNSYKNVVAVRKAAFSRTGKVDLLLSQYSAAHSLYHPVNLYQTVNSADAIVVDAISLDEFFENRDCSIDVIKMDIQGAEMAAVMGMSQTLKKNDNLKIFTEFWPSGLQRSEFSARE